MNGEELMTANVHQGSVGGSESRTFTDSNYMDPNESRQVLSTSTQNVAHSLATLLYRAVQQAEKSTDLTSLFASEHTPAHPPSSSSVLFSAAEGRQYHQAKQTLLARAEIRRANPAFNATQWHFLGLLLVDALVLRKVLNLTGEREYTPSIDPSSTNADANKDAITVANTNVARANIWSTHFSRAVLVASGGKEMLDSLLEPRELQNLRSFFYVDN